MAYHGSIEEGARVLRNHQSCLHDERDISSMSRIMSLSNWGKKGGEGGCPKFLFHYRLHFL